MCLILFAPEVSKIPQSWLTNSNSSNPHGIGAVYRDERGLNLVKGLRYGELLHLMATLEQKNPSIPIAIHFRFATHGGKTAELTHPFVVDKENSDLNVDGIQLPVMMHNGTISDLTLTEAMHYAGVPEPRQRELISLMRKSGIESYSDSKVLAEAMAYVDRDEQRAILYAIAKTEWSKFLLWHPDQDMPELFSSSFTEKDGIYLSNTSSIASSYRYTTGNYGYNSYNYTKPATTTAAGATKKTDSYYQKDTYKAVSNTTSKDEVVFEHDTDEVSLNSVSGDNQCDICEKQREASAKVGINSQDVFLCKDCSLVCGFISEESKK